MKRIIFFSVLLFACKGNRVINAVQRQNDFEQLRTASAISCTNGMATSDSSIYMVAGAADFQATQLNENEHPGKIPGGMVFIPGGEFSMGAPNPVGMSDGGNENMSDARPIHRVQIGPFFMDEHEVTNAEFAAFVKATGYVTVAEKAPTPQEFPDALPEMLVAGSVVFTPPPYPVSLNNPYAWWNYKKGADWRHPNGPESDLVGKENHPVVHVAWEDAHAYAQWAGKRLPTEAEWEFAARGGLTGNRYTWGNQFRPEGQFMANSFQGRFPGTDSHEDGFAGIAPVKQFPANGFGLYDMAGNVWEWCADWYRSDYYEQQKKTGVSVNPQGPADSYDPTEPGVPKKVQRGGSYLCTDQYCTRYMMGTRGKGEWRSSTNHIGFRCVKEVKIK